MLSIRGTNFISHWAYEFLRMLSIRETNFIASWACAEMFKSRISWPNRIRFSKISCYRPLGPYGFGFCKKVKKIISCLCTFKGKRFRGITCIGDYIYWISLWSSLLPIGSLSELLPPISPLFWLQYIFQNCWKTIQGPSRNNKICSRPSNLVSFFIERYWTFRPFENSIREYQTAFLKTSPIITFSP
jgi:hypothetical protein